MIWYDIISKNKWYFQCLLNLKINIIRPLVAFKMWPHVLASLLFLMPLAYSREVFVCSEPGQCEQSVPLSFTTALEESGCLQKCKGKVPSSSAPIPMSICTLQCLFSHSFTTYEWLNRDCDGQIYIGITSRWTGYRTRTQTEVRNSDSDSDLGSDLRNRDFPTPWPKIISQWNTYDILTIVDICACGL
jgi:hypothetical protein